MCRLFAQVSAAPQDASYGLCEARYSLIKQSDLKKDRLQKDGWGIGSFENGRPLIVKSARAAFEERESFQKAARSNPSSMTIGHIRAASNPRKIAEERLLSVENSQPFAGQETWLFAHNGTVEIPDELAETLGPLKKRIRSLNDSEVYFWQFLKFVQKTGDPGEAFVRCAEELWDLWKSCAKSHADKKAPYTSLNAVASNGRRLYVFCHAVEKQAGPSLHDSGQPWYTMCFGRRGKTLIAASEGLDDGEWALMRTPEVLIAETSGENFKTTRRRYDFENGRLTPAADQALEIPR